MLTPTQVIRVEFNKGCGSSSILLAVSDLNDAKSAIEAYEAKTNSTFVKIEESCVMTPILYSKVSYEHR